MKLTKLEKFLYPILLLDVILGLSLAIRNFLLGNFMIGIDKILMILWIIGFGFATYNWGKALKGWKETLEGWEKTDEKIAS